MLHACPRSLWSSVGALRTSAELGDGPWDSEWPQTQGKFGECEVRWPEAQCGREESAEGRYARVSEVILTGDFAPVGCTKILDSKESQK